MRTMGGWGRRVATFNYWTLTPEHLKLTPAPKQLGKKTACSVLSSLLPTLSCSFILKKSYCT